MYNPGIASSCKQACSIYAIVSIIGCVEKHQTDWSSTSDQEGWQTSCGDSVLPSWKLCLKNGFHEECSSCSGGDSTTSPCGWTHSDALQPCMENACDFCGHGFEHLLLIFSVKAQGADKSYLALFPVKFIAHSHYSTRFSSCGSIGF